MESTEVGEFTEEGYNPTAYPTNRSLVEIIAVSIFDFFDFIYSSFYFGYHKTSGNVEHYTFCGANPDQLTEEQIESKPILLLHGAQHNQSGWRDLIAYLEKKGYGPIFTVNIDYDNDDTTAKINEKAAEILKLYQDGGHGSIDLTLIGHSRGAIEACEFVYINNCDSLPQGITIDKVVSVAGRLGITGEERYPFFFSDIVDKVNAINQAILNADSDAPPLYTIAAENDSIIPSGGTHIQNEPRNETTIRWCGHLSILRSTQMFEKLLEIIKA